MVQAHNKKKPSNTHEGDSPKSKPNINDKFAEKGEIEYEKSSESVRESNAQEGDTDFYKEDVSTPVSAEHQRNVAIMDHIARLKAKRIQCLQTTSKKSTNLQSGTENPQDLISL